MSTAPFILLVNPWITDFAAYDLWSKPLGLLIIGALLREGGCGVAFLDCLDRFDPETIHRNDMLPATFQKYGKGKYPKMPISTPDILANIPRRYYRYGIHPDSFMTKLGNLPKPDLVLVTCSMTYWYPGTQETIRVIREIYPSVPIWLGGVYARLCTDHAISYSGATRVYTKPLSNLCDDLQIALGYTFSNRASWKSPDQWPLATSSKILNSPGYHAPLLTSLGCPNHCPYCASNSLEPKFIRFSTQSIIDQVILWHDLHDIRDFAFYDDALLCNAETTLKPALEELAGLDLNIRFHAPNALHINKLSFSWCDLLMSSGLVNLNIGLETTNDRLQKMLGNKTNNDSFLRVMKHLNAIGFPPRLIGVYLLCGLPNQSPKDVYNSIQLVKNSGARPLLAEYSPIPKTRIFEQLPAEVRALCLREPLTHNNSYFACRRPDFTYQDLLELKKKPDWHGAQKMWYQYKESLFE